MRELRGAVVRWAFLIAAVCLCGVSPPLIGSAVAKAGAGCCATLEARVAELEATSARKGGRVTSLQVHGEVNRAPMLWNDGFDTNELLLFAQYHRYEGSTDGVPCGRTCKTLSYAVQSLPVDTWSAVVLGARLQF